MPSLSQSKPIVQQSYYKYRSIVTKYGWKPFVKHQKYKNHISESEFGDAHIMRSSGYVEIEKCSGVENNVCSFKFKKGKLCKIVNTIGENDINKKWPIAISYKNAKCNK